jgi:hypothetical protein
MSVAKSSCPVLDNPSTPVKTQLASKHRFLQKNDFAFEALCTSEYWDCLISYDFIMTHFVVAQPRAEA